MTRKIVTFNLKFRANYDTKSKRDKMFYFKGKYSITVVQVWSYIYVAPKMHPKGISTFVQMPTR